MLSAALGIHGAAASGSAMMILTPAARAPASISGGRGASVTMLSSASKPQTRTKDRWPNLLLSQSAVTALDLLHENRLDLGIFRRIVIETVFIDAADAEEEAVEPVTRELLAA